MEASDPSRMNWAVGREESGMGEGPSPSKEEGREGNLNEIVLFCQIGCMNYLEAEACQDAEGREAALAFHDHLNNNRKLNRLVFFLI